MLRGKIEGKVTSRYKLQLWIIGQILREVQTDRLAIEDGALLRGRVEAGKQPAKTSEIKASAATAAGKSYDSASLNSGTAAD
jgi:cytoskeletal protein CcmA (bactofilin family)